MTGDNTYFDTLIIIFLETPNFSGVLFIVYFRVLVDFFLGIPLFCVTNQTKTAMNRLLLTVVLATVCGLSLLAQNPNVSIKIDTAERFRFEGNRLNFLNPGRNVLIGDSAGYYMYNKAQGNVYIGDLTGLFDTTGMLNTFIGGQAGYSNRNGYRNTFIGFCGAGQNNINGYLNTFVGLWSGASECEWIK
ncbi:MAG: hypothetical protein MZU84_07865 [Sphingobacterium sp.]|nr:hypothetical protein [Sphingobacterium sp.]